MKIIIAHDPDRYSCGLRNWALLNKNVAILQKKLKGKLPARDNILTLLSSAVRENVAKPSMDARRLTDHKMAPQKRVLEDFAIKFPNSKAIAMEKRCATFDSDQEERDFRLALKLQQKKWNHLSQPLVVLLP